MTLFFYLGFLSQTLAIHKTAGEEGLTIHRAAREGRGPSFIRLYHFHPLTNIQTYICNFVRCKMRDVTWLFLIATLVFTRLLLDEIYHLIELSFDSLTDDATLVCLIDSLILGFCYSNLTRETGGFEPTSTITIVLQSSQLIKCASHP